MDMLTLSHVNKCFGHKKVLQDVSFSVREHTVFGFVGQNGAGKTTAMKLILGLLTPDSGEICVNGRPVRYGDTDTNQYIGYLPDVPEFYPYMTPSEYLRFCGEFTGMHSKEISARTEELLCLTGLEKEDRRIRGFSRGMKQRLGVAQALLSRPKLLICDEPASALDPAGRRELLDILEMAGEQATVLFSTHILSDVEQICDEFAFLHNGKIVRQDTLENLRQKKKSSDVVLEMELAEDAQMLLKIFSYLRSGGHNRILLEKAEMLPEILHYIANNKIPFLRLERQEMTIEDLFMEVVGK